MSINRCIFPLASASFAFRFAASTEANTLRALPSTVRNFNSGRQQELPSKRKLVTATAYRPNSLDSIHPPPLSVRVPESSIPGALPKFNDTRPPTLAGEQTSPLTYKQAERLNLGVPETEAQKTEPVADLPQSRPKLSRLRPRKAAMSLTPSATKQLRTLLALPEPKLIRVGVKNRGCSGLAYHLEYVEKPGTFDESVEQDGVKVLVDSKALFSIIGSEMDWVEDKLNQRFVFRNPNISQIPLKSLNHLRLIILR